MKRGRDPADTWCALQRCNRMPPRTSNGKPKFTGFAMTIIEDRTRHTPQADAEGWLTAFEAALQSQDAAAAAGFLREASPVVEMI